MLTFQHAGVHHRRAVLCFLAQLDVDELQLFFSLLLKPLFAPGHGTDSSCEKSKDGLQVFDLVEFSRTIGDLSFKKICGFLHVVKDILKAFDEIHIRPFLKLLMGFVVRIVETCILNITGANHFNPLLLGDISSCDLKSQEKESIAHNSVKVWKCDLLCSCNLVLDYEALQDGFVIKTTFVCFLRASLDTVVKKCVSDYDYKILVYISRYLRLFLATWLVFISSVCKFSSFVMN